MYGADERLPRSVLQVCLQETGGPNPRANAQQDIDYGVEF